MVSQFLSADLISQFLVFIRNGDLHLRSSSVLGYGQLLTADKCTSLLSECVLYFQNSIQVVSLVLSLLSDRDILKGGWRRKKGGWTVKPGYLQSLADFSIEKLVRV